ncbi:MAG: hypothetical protein JSW11_00850 [Candidatus Heimdallarchaeota archaeon]|nr:MAG: hypothetical protein JSW11_00850 [Candidatus Heimdallarchaeota archaeon]
MTEFKIGDRIKTIESITFVSGEILPVGERGVINYIFQNVSGSGESFVKAIFDFFDSECVIPIKSIQLLKKSIIMPDEQELRRRRDKAMREALGF